MTDSSTTKARKNRRADKTQTRVAKKKIATTYDVADHLRTPDEQAAYLDAWHIDAPEDSAGVERAHDAVARARQVPRAAKAADRPRTKRRLTPPDSPA